MDFTISVHQQEVTETLQARDVTLPCFVLVLGFLTTVTLKNGLGFSCWNLSTRNCSFFTTSKPLLKQNI